MESSIKDKTEGKIKETGGEAVGNKNLAAEGKGKNLERKVQEKIGYVKKVGKNNEVFLISRHNLGTRK